MPSTVLNPSIHLQEDNFGVVRFTCIGINSTVGTRVSEQQTACTDACKTYRTVPCRTVPYRTVPYSSVPYRTVPCRTVPFTVLVKMNPRVRKHVEDIKIKN